MALTLQDVLVRALKKLEKESFHRFIAILSVWEVEKQYENIPLDELRGKDPEHVAGLINRYYRYAYGAEVTLAVLEDISERKVREELQLDLMEVDSSNVGLGTAKFTDKVNFIDNHQSDLWAISDLDPILRDLQDQDLLTEEQCNDVRRKTKSRERVKDLCDIICRWEDTGKYTAYQAFRRHYAETIYAMEKGVWKYMCKVTFFGDLSVTKHRSDLINSIKEVSPVIDDLRSNHLLTEEEDKALQEMTTPEEQMTHLCDIFSHKPDTVKNQFYISLWRYNYTTITTLEILFRQQKLKRQVQVRIPIRGGGSAPLANAPTTSQDVPSSLNPEIEKPTLKRTGTTTEVTQMSDTEMEDEGTSCKLCGKVKLHQDSVEVMTPTISGSSYSLSMNSPGLFRCSESGIQFRVTEPVTIEYEVDSWSNYTETLQNLRGRYEIIGPLFNIKTRIKPNVVSAVYLPHCLCLGGFKKDKSLIRCFHYQDDNMVLETPSRLEPMYAVLENPTFSCIGVILFPLSFFKEKIIKFIPCHGMALLFCNAITRDDGKHKYRLHLYLLPMIRTVEKKVERDETKYSFKRIYKPPQTESVYPKTKYRINGPLIANVLPKTLLFESSCPSEIYPFTEIRGEGTENTEVKVSLHPEDKDVAVWETVVSAEEMLELPSSTSRFMTQPEKCHPLSEKSVHFVDKHRADLIRMISVVDLVLDDLLDPDLLSNEQYKTVLSKNTKSEQMRELYDCIRSWGNDDKDRVYRSLKTHNRPIIKQLEKEEVPAEDDEPQTSVNPSKCSLN